MTIVLRTAFFATFWLALSACPRPSIADDLSSEQIDQISRTVVRIVALRNGEPFSTGSGTLVSANGVIYTNRHVIEDGNDYIVELIDDPNELPVPTYRASLTGYSMNLDFAVLQIDRTVDGTPVSADSLSLPFLPSRSADVSRGDPIFVFGYPGIGDGYLAFTEGTITTIRNGMMNDARMPVWYQTDAQISPGNSGGLAVNERGEMIGIPTEVYTEERTLGRLGGLLPVTAAQEAVSQGLEQDLARIDSATAAPVIEGGELDFTQDPAFDNVALSAGFSPDPYTVEMVSGGEVAVSYLGGDCTGYAAVAPDFRLNWAGSSAELRFFFTAADGGDTTLLVNQPDGSWLCNDDSGDSLDPMIALANPAEGQYDIWVGSYEAGAYVPGTLHVTELDLQPSSVSSGELDLSADPFYGSLALSPGFSPNPGVIEMEAGGSIDVSYLGNGCAGFAAEAPDVRLQWTGSTHSLSFSFSAEQGGDTSLIINLPDGSWICDDDSGRDFNPLISLGNPMSGQYDIWVGTYEQGPTRAGALIIAE